MKATEERAVCEGGEDHIILVGDQIYVTRHQSVKFMEILGGSGLSPASAPTFGKPSGKTNQVLNIKIEFTDHKISA